MTCTAVNNRIRKFSVFPCELSLMIYSSKGNSNLREHQRQTALLKVPVYLAVTSQLRACVQVSPSACAPLASCFRESVSVQLWTSASHSLWTPECLSQIQPREEGIYYLPAGQYISLVVWFRARTIRRPGTGKVQSSDLFRFSSSTSKV